MSITTDSRERPEWGARAFASDLDPGIAVAVHLLLDHGIETYESCQGGPGHMGGAGDWPVVRFYGERSEGFKALAVAQMYGLPVHALNRVWRVDDGEPTGPNWELVFRPGPVGSSSSPAELRALRAGRGRWRVTVDAPSSASADDGREG